MQLSKKISGFIHKARNFSKARRHVGHVRYVIYQTL